MILNGSRAVFASAAIFASAAFIYPAAAQTYSVNIPSQPLADSLRTLGSSLGVNVAFEARTVRGYVAPAIQGNYSAEEALDLLVAGSGLAVKGTGARSFIVLRNATPSPIHKSSHFTVPIANQGATAAYPASDTIPQAGGLEEIIVTAQKSATNLQQTPISISVLGNEALDDRNIRSLSDFSDGSVPSLRVAPSALARTSALVVGIRGIVPVDATQLSRDTSVGIYLDGVFLSRVQGLGTELLEIERIEILKGPQGTLFGRNAVGGAVSIVSKKPTGEFGGSARLGVSNYDGFNTDAHINLPEFSNISIKLDGIFSKRGGTVDNRLAGARDFQQFRKWGLHAAVLWEPTSDISVQYDFDRSRDASTPYYTQIVELFPGAPPLSPLVSVQPGREKVSDVGVPLQWSVGEVSGHSLHANWNVAPGVELRSITAYRELKQSQYDNSGAHRTAFRPDAIFGRYSQAFVNQHQFSQEFQLVGSGDSLEYVAGAYYFHENGDDYAYSTDTLRWNADGTDYNVLAQPIGGPFPERSSKGKASSLAVYGQMTWTPPVLDSRLHLTGGLRYTRDKKNGRLTAIRGVDPNLAFRFGSNRIDPSFTAAFDITDRINAYAKWGRAYRAGGANSRSETFRTFNEEVVETSEIGIKSELFDRRLRLNVAAYDTKYKNMQIDFLSSTISGNYTETVNTNRPGKIRGFEAEATFRPISALTLGASYAYTDAKIPDQLNPFTGLTEPLHVVYTPKNAVSGSVDFEAPVGSLRARLHLDANAADGYYSLPANPERTEASFVVNGRLSLEDIRLGGATVTLAAWSRNLFNESHIMADALLPNVGLIQGRLGVINLPRTFGVDATMRF
jgi:iron complex outermembrane receptor protein